MEIYSTEEEQVEAIKKWWRENWKSLFGGILLGLGILYGGRAWFKQQEIYVSNASVQYESMVQAMAQDKKSEAADFAAKLLGQYTDTPYAVMASLTMAKVKLDEKDTVTAKTHLRWALDHTSQESFQHVARLRLARILLSEGKYDEALEQLSNVDTGKYQASYEEVKGDVYVAKGQIELARTAYSLALTFIKAGARQREILEMKLDDLGERSQPTGTS